MTRPVVPEELVGLVHALSEDPALRQWLRDLQPLSMVERRSILTQIAEQMEAGGEDPALVSAMRALTRPALFDAACQTLAELEAK
jgi:hypothetical protein